MARITIVSHVDRSPRAKKGPYYWLWYLIQKDGVVDQPLGGRGFYC